jgi:acetyltransferase-like isoleucine patch superfamily enzyme
MKNRVFILIKPKLQKIIRNMFPVRGKNNIIINKGTLFNVKYDIIGDNNVIEISKGAVLSNMMIFMRGNNHHLKIGEYVKYKRGSVWFEDENCVIEIGEKTTIESAHLAVTEPKRKIIIGYDCMFSNSIEFRTGDSHSIIDNETKKRINFAQDIIVGNHVWIGANSIILKGAKIGDNSIVGINSIVTKAFPNNSIVSGIPAKVIKDKVDWVRERINYS